MYILPLLCNQNENYYCWSSMIMSSYFNVQYLRQKMIRIYADIVQNHTLPVFPNFWRAVYISQFKKIDTYDCGPGSQINFICFTCFSTTAGSMLGTWRMENLAMTLAGMTVLVPGEENAPSMPWIDTVGWRQRWARRSTWWSQEGEKWVCLHKAWILSK